MSEETEEPAPAERQQAGPKKKRLLSFKRKMALLEIIERKQMGYHCDYNTVAQRHNVPKNSLRQIYSSWTRGEIDLGAPATPEEKQIDARMQHETTLALLRRYKAMILKGFEGLIYKAEDLMTNGNAMAFDEVGLPKVLQELKKVTEVQTLHERGYASILEDLLGQANRSKPAMGTGQVTAEMETQIVHANDQEKMLLALKNLVEPEA